MRTRKKPKILFVVGIFPAISESWLVEQLAGLYDAGVDIDLASFRQGDPTHSSDIIRKYKIIERTTYLKPPSSFFSRIVGAVPLALRLIGYSPWSFFRALNVARYGKAALGLHVLYWSGRLVPNIREYNLIHCHHGMIANRFLVVRDVLGLTQPLIMTLYGQDSNKYIELKGARIYDRLKHIASAVLVMTTEMKERLIRFGFSEKKLHVHCTGINPSRYEFHERSYDSRLPFHIISIGRFVRKKGFDDFIRMLGVLKRNRKNVMAHIIGDAGDVAYKEEMLALAADEGVSDVIQWLGLRPHVETTFLLKGMHLMVQLSKRGPDGDTDDLPFVLLEGQACGLPAISTRHVGISDGVDDGVSGWLVPEEDYKSAAEKVTWLMENSDQLSKMSLLARKFVVNKFDLTLLNRRLLLYYLALINHDS